MGKRIDISKIYDSHHNLIAVLNYNQMIPVTDSQIVKYNINVLKTDNEYWRKYKKLCEQELRWCRKHEEEIKGKAKLLYQMYTYVISIRVLRSSLTGNSFLYNSASSG